jgi:hypothetical protein
LIGERHVADEPRIPLHLPIPPSDHGVVFCPKCGRPMTIVNGTFVCIEGDMELSHVLRDSLSEVFVARTRDGRPRAFDWGGRWFCPGCGCPASTEAEHVRCATCGQYLDEFLYALVELHPHR